jgi:NlpC/P60 family
LLSRPPTPSRTRPQYLKDLPDAADRTRGMSKPLRRRTHLTAMLLVAAAANACASSSALVRPSPFPTAPPPPAAIRPSVPVGPSVLEMSSVVQAALDLRGVPYVFGGEDPSSGFDCSGFVRYVFGLVHVDLPRTVAEQYALGRSVPATALSAGDLVFFSTVAPGASHVGIALGPTGNDEFIHAPSSDGVVRVERLSASYWHDRLIGARRLF